MWHKCSWASIQNTPYTIWIFKFCKVQLHSYYMYTIIRSCGRQDHQQHWWFPECFVQTEQQHLDQGSVLSNGHGQYLWSDVHCSRCCKLWLCIHVHCSHSPIPTVAASDYYSSLHQPFLNLSRIWRQVKYIFGWKDHHYRLQQWSGWYFPMKEVQILSVLKAQSLEWWCRALA